MALKTCAAKKSGLRKQTGSILAEFAPSLMVLFMFIFFPLINLMGLATGCASVMLITNQAAQVAATEQTYNDSLEAMLQGTNNFLGNGISKFCGARPVGGYRDCGVDLYTQATKLSGATTKIGPNVPLTPPVDTTDNVYEYVATSHFTITPLVSMSKIPLLGKIPGLGTPTTINFSSTRLVEHPQGLVGSVSANASGPSLGLFDRSLVGASSPSSASSASSAASGAAGASYNYGSWRDPNIFEQIAAAGQTVVAINVVQVKADYGTASSGWVSSGLSIQPGQSCWIDTRADGYWTSFIMGKTVDANGITGTQTPALKANDIDLDLPNSMLIGYVGNPPQLGYRHENTGISGDSRFIPSGNTLLNYQLNHSGPISLAMNDNECADQGFQTVRVIIAQ